MGQVAGYTLARSPACYRALSSLASEIYKFVYSKWALSLLGSATPWEIKQRTKLALWSLPFSALWCLPQGRLSLKEDWAPWKQLSWDPEIVHIHNSWQNPTSCRAPENVEKHSLEDIYVLDIKMWITTLKKIQIAQTFGNDLTCPRKRCPRLPSLSIHIFLFTLHNWNDPSWRCLQGWLLRYSGDIVPVMWRRFHLCTVQDKEVLQRQKKDEREGSSDRNAHQPWSISCK